MKIKFLGAAGTVTGSCYLLTSDSGAQILIDCGLFQGSVELESLNFSHLNCDCSKVTAVILTHAHLDHCGRLPVLLSEGFTGQIYMTPPTSDIAELSLLDSAKINKEDKRELYDKQRVRETVAKFRTIDYNVPFSIADFNIVLRNAGHILGSASVEVNNMFFSGDLGNSPEDLIASTQPIANGQIVVMESTYGDRTHPTENPWDVIKSEINAVEESGGTLLIPAFSIERSQEILHIISHLKKTGGVKSETPIFFDSPMAQKVTVIFEKYRQYFNAELKDDFATGDPFNFPGMVLLEPTQGPSVIISGSGMMTGGRIVGHSQKYLPISSTRILIVGYQAEGTMGRQILEGSRTVIIDKKQINIKATINETQAMSSHADQPKLLAWLKNIKGV
jgi:metallo-beta-lactamase family protein